MYICRCDSVSHSQMGWVVHAMKFVCISMCECLFRARIRNASINQHDIEKGAVAGCQHSMYAEKNGVIINYCAYMDDVLSHHII